MVELKKVMVPSAQLSTPPESHKEMPLGVRSVESPRKPWYTKFRKIIPEMCTTSAAVALLGCGAARARGVVKCFVVKTDRPGADTVKRIARGQIR